MRVHRNKLEVLRGRMIVHRGRDVRWQEFANACDLTANTICNLLKGRSGGNMKTVDKIVNGLRAAGLAVDRSDVLGE